MITLERIKKIIANLEPEHEDFVNYGKVAERYYLAENDILKKPLQTDSPENPRNAHNRLPSKLFQIIVNQKSSYIFGKEVVFDLNKRYPGDEEGGTNVPYGGSIANMTVQERQRLGNKLHRVLGSSWGRTCRRLCMDASIYGRAILHYWIEGIEYGIPGEKKGKFRYGRVDPKEIIPIWGNKLDRDLLAVLRHYLELDVDGVQWEVYEYWDDEFCTAFRKKKDLTTRGLKPYNKFFYFSTDTNDYDATNIYKHGLGRVPFIILKNNPHEVSDLKGLKETIDVYDLVRSMNANDLEDFQEMIFVLSGYGAEPPENFLQKLKKNKLIKLEGGYNGKDYEKPSLETLAVEIPTEASKLAMDETRRAIYEQGAGVDQTPEMLNYTSSEALKYRYALLELAAGILQDEFENGFNILVKAICDYLGQPIDDEIIEQRWTRTKVNNDTELVNNARLCLGFTSLRTALLVNPYVDDVDEELERIEIERRQEMEQQMEYAENMNRLEMKQSGDRQSDYQNNRNSSEKKVNEPEKYIYAKKRQESKNSINLSSKGQ